MALRLEVVGEKALEERLDVLLGELDDMDGLWDRLAVVMVETEAEWFATLGQGVWPPLADSTVREKERGGWPLEPMIRRGLLLESLVDPEQAMDVSQGRSTLGTFTRKSMTWGTSVTDDRGREFAHYHQHTSPVTGEEVDYGGDPPLRQVIEWPLSPSTQAKIQTAAEEWLAEALRKSDL